jgi:glycosyltransferase involved in cell wall biosynthesis
MPDQPKVRGKRFLLSLVVPMRNEEDSIGEFMTRVRPAVEQVGCDYEIVCVNDGSSDRTLEILKTARAGDRHIKIVDLARNFGKDLALTAGIDHAEGDAIIPLDADLQDPPELIPDLVAKWREGNDMVIAVRRDRQSDSLAKRLSANLFYRAIGRMSDVPIPANAGDYRIMDRRVIDALKSMPERNRFMKGIFAWVGFKQARIHFDRPARVAGASKWSFWKLWNFALDGIFSFSTLPLRIWTYFGVILAVFALGYAVLIAVRTLIMGVDVPGYASLAVILLFFSGLNMIGLGIIGEYLGRVFIEVKHRPLYLVRETIGLDPSEAAEAQASETADEPRRDVAQDKGPPA